MSADGYSDDVKLFRYMAGIVKNAVNCESDRIITLRTFMQFYISFAFNNNEEVRRSRIANDEFWGALTALASFTCRFKQSFD